MATRKAEFQTLCYCLMIKNFSSSMFLSVNPLLIITLQCSCNCLPHFLRFYRLHTYEITEPLNKGRCHNSLLTNHRVSNLATIYRTSREFTDCLCTKLRNLLIREGVTIGQKILLSFGYLTTFKETRTKSGSELWSMHNLVKK